MENDTYINLFINNQKLIYNFVSKKTKYYFLFDSKADMIQELSLELWKRIKKYNTQYAFSTFVNLVLTNYCKKKCLDRNKKQDINVVLSADLEIEDKNIMDNLVDNKLDVLQEIYNREDLDTMSDISKDIINGHTFSEVEKKYNVSACKIYGQLKKDNKKIKMRNRSDK